MAGYRSYLLRSFDVQERRGHDSARKDYGEDQEEGSYEGRGV